MRVDLDAIEELLRVATPGPWVTHYADDGGKIRLVGILHDDGELLVAWGDGDGTSDDAELIARSRFWLVELVDEVRRLRD